MEEAVESVTRKLLGSSGPGGTDSEALQGWLVVLHYVLALKLLFDWLANGSPPWAAYRAFMSGLLIVIDKHPGVHLVGVGETWRPLFETIVIKVTGSEATMACHYDQLCAGLEAGIDSVIHRVQDICEEQISTE